MKDRITKFLAYEGKIMVVCANTTALVEKARQTHDLSPVATAAFGRLLTIGAMMGAEMKGQKDKLTIQVKGDGPLGMMVVTTNYFPKVKGYVTNPLVDLPLNELGKLDVGGAVGSTGFLNVIKDIGLKEPYIGISPLISGEIAEDFANYFVTSEQKQTAVGLGVLVNSQGVKASGGYLIMPMPDATEQEISKVEKAIFEAGAISKMLDQNLTLEQIAKKITGDENVQVIEEHKIPLYECDCSREHMAEGLIAIGKQELQDIIETQGKAELVCHFCNQIYEFTKQELEELSREMKAPEIIENKIDKEIK